MPYLKGDPVPWFNADTHTTPQFQFSAAAGRYVVLSFLGSTSLGASEQVVRDIEQRRTEFSDERVCFFGVSIDPTDFDNGRVREFVPGVRYFKDFQHFVSEGYGAISKGLTGTQALLQYRPFSLVLDQRLRTIVSIPINDSGIGHINKVLDVVCPLPDFAEHSDADMQAPVLIVPNIFEPEFCKELIKIYEDQCGEDSGFMRDQAGKTVGIYDYGTKRRRDQIIEDEVVRKKCIFKIHDRLAPEIRRAGIDKKSQVRIKKQVILKLALHARVFPTKDGVKECESQRGDLEATLYNRLQGRADKAMHNLFC